ncbi:MAG: hypothetical protein ABSG45_10205 [Nitrososphaerales archaeon]|jgi:hypothetical protein
MLIYRCSIVFAEANALALDPGGSRRKSISVHFRIWTDVYESLEDEATRRKVNMNTLVNQLLSHDMHDYLPLQEMGFLKMSRDVYLACLSAIPDDKLNDVGIMSAKSEDTVMLARSGVINLQAVLEELNLVSSFGWYSFQQGSTNGKKTIDLVHSLGQRYSVVLGGFVKGMFALAGVHPKVTTTHSSVMVEY